MIELTNKELSRIKCYIINLKRRADRRCRMEKDLPPFLHSEFTTFWEDSLDSVDINEVTLRNFGLFPWKIDSDNKWWNRPLKKGEVGCSISHWLCWGRAINTNYDYFLILEDDVFFSAIFEEALNWSIQQLNINDPSWDLLYLGRVPLEKDKNFIDGIVRPGYSHCTFAYVLTLPGIQKLISAEFEKSLIPVDEFLPAMYIDHPREDVRKRYPRKLSAYALSKDIVFQLPKSLAGSDTEDSDFIM